MFSSQFTSSTLSILGQQQVELERATKEKEEQIKRLNDVDKSLTYITGQTSEAVKESLEIIQKSPVASPLKSQLQPTLNQFKEMVKQIETGEATKATNNHIKELNEEVGVVEANVEDLEQEVQGMDIPIELLRKRIEERRELINSTNKKTKEIQ